MEKNQDAITIKTYRGVGGVSMRKPDGINKVYILYYNELKDKLNLEGEIVTIYTIENGIQITTECKQDE
jgi:hypothetical protein